MEGERGERGDGRREEGGRGPHERGIGEDGLRWPRYSGGTHFEVVNL